MDTKKQKIDISCTVSIAVESFRGEIEFNKKSRNQSKTVFMKSKYL